VTRSEQNNYEFITTCIGFVIIELHHHANTGTVTYHLPIQGDASAAAGGTTSIGELEINLQMLSNLDDIVDDTSSIGSDLSFIHKEQTISPQHASRKSTNQSNFPSSPSSHRVVGGTIPEAGKSSNWAFNSTASLQQETEVKLTEISIVKMHLERMIVEKENLESIQQMHLKEITKLQNELREMKLERNKPLTPSSIGKRDSEDESLVLGEDIDISLVSALDSTGAPPSPSPSPSITGSQTSMTPKSVSARGFSSSVPSENVILSIDRMVELENENKSLKLEVESWKEKYEQLLLVSLPVERKVALEEQSA
jgi:hypothetical protein